MKRLIDRLANFLEPASESRSFLYVEQLESRTLLSGNVVVEMIGADLFVSGDDQANQIELLADESGNLTLIGTDGTTINSGSEGFVVSEGSLRFADDIRVNLRGGDDQFLIRDGITIDGSVRIKTGSGNDFVGVSAAAINERLSVFTFSGGRHNRV